MFFSGANEDLSLSVINITQITAPTRGGTKETEFGGTWPTLSSNALQFTTVYSWVSITSFSERAIKLRISIITAERPAETFNG